MSSSGAEARAFALLQADRLAEAEAAWREILGRDPADVRAQHFLGCVLARTGRLEEALALLDRSIGREPRNAMFLANRARVLGDAGRLDAAIEDLRRAVRSDPRFGAAYHHLGLLLERAGRREESLAALRRAVAIDPHAPGANASLGRALLASGDAAGARDAFERAVAARPGDPELLNNLGLALNTLGHAEAAIARYREALARRPAFAEARLNCGHALRDAGDLRAAAAMYAQALADRPGFLEAMLARAGAALDLGDLAAAREGYEQVLASTGESADARYGLGQVALREGRYAEGWAGYAWRFATHPPQSIAREIPLPALDAALLGSVRRVFVWGEQGLGDQLLFASLLPELESRGIGMVLDVDARLAPLLARHLRGACVASGDRAFEGCDAHIPLGSLGALFRPDAASFARQPRALLAADPARAAQVAAMLPAASQRIGISWRSFRDRGRGALAARKSAPLERFAALGREGVVLVDLQYGDVSEERARFCARYPGLLARVPGLDPVADLEGLLAAIEACDRVVTTSNVTAHLAGALGKPTLLVFPGGNPPFAYWTFDGEGRTPWYPSVRVVSGPELDTWEKVLERAAALTGREGQATD
jgi:tetratricopeptide (TPR) repeat protein